MFRITRRLIAKCAKCANQSNVAYLKRAVIQGKNKQVVITAERPEFGKPYGPDKPLVELSPRKEYPHFFVAGSDTLALAIVPKTPFAANRLRSHHDNGWLPHVFGATCVGFSVGYCNLLMEPLSDNMFYALFTGMTASGAMLFLATGVIPKLIVSRGLPPAAKKIFWRAMFGI